MLLILERKPEIYKQQSILVAVVLGGFRVVCDGSGL
jgi:hypothetical protein